VGVGAEPPPADPGAPAAEPPAEGGVDAGALNFLNIASTNRGDVKNYANPIVGAQTFLTNMKSKDIRKIAESIALRAPLEAKSTVNQKLFMALLEETLAQEDVDEFARKLENYQINQVNAAKSSGMRGVTITRAEGTSIMRRTIMMRLEKAGWKVQDISGEGELEKPIIMPRIRGGMPGRRR
jgi:hypothetical protein